MGKKTVIGVLLIIMQILIIKYGLLSSQENIDSFKGEEFSYYIGFFIPTIVGIILIGKDIHNKQKGK
ncbi:MAG: hypothetical protein KQ78_00432 [Candidatus Izimaplasma bacterium HR2]|nr:MAG: hypothetical protein KQ78_00432 [Candidatus Izimaplasma bacterium HR2]